MFFLLFCRPFSGREWETERESRNCLINGVIPNLAVTNLRTPRQIETRDSSGVTAIVGRVKQFTMARLQRPIGIKFTLRVTEDGVKIKHWMENQWKSTGMMVATNSTSTTVFRSDRELDFHAKNGGHRVLLALTSKLRPTPVVASAEIAIENNIITMRRNEFPIDQASAERDQMDLIIGLPAEINWTMTIQDHTVEDVIDTDLIRYRLGTQHIEIPRYYEQQADLRIRNQHDRARRARNLREQIERMKLMAKQNEIIAIENLAAVRVPSRSIARTEPNKTQAEQTEADDTWSEEGDRYLTSTPPDFGDPGTD